MVFKNTQRMGHTMEEIRTKQGKQILNVKNAIKLMPSMPQYFSYFFLVDQNLDT